MKPSQSACLAMINFTDMTGLASSAIAMTAMVARLPGVARLQNTHFVLLVCTIAIGALIPFGGLPIAAYVRGWMGDLSITSLMLLLMILLRPVFGWSKFALRARISLLILIVLAALMLYPMALGMGSFDPYRWGYGNPWFLCCWLLLAVAACFCQLALVVFAIALAVLAWGAGWYESTNLWDYLLDPLLAIYATSALVRNGIQILLKLRRG